MTFSYQVYLRFPFDKKYSTNYSHAMKYLIIIFLLFAVSSMLIFLKDIMMVLKSSKKGRFKMVTKYPTLKLSDEQVKKFKERETMANSLISCRKLAVDLIEIGDKEWATHICKKAENFAVNSTDCLILGKFVKNDKYLGNKEWAIELFKESENYCRIAQKELPNKDLSKRRTVKKIFLEIENYGKLSENVDDIEWSERLKKELEYFALELDQLLEKRVSKILQRIENRNNKKK